MKSEFILTLERVRADIADALLAAHRDDIDSVEKSLTIARDRMQALVQELRAA